MWRKWAIVGASIGLIIGTIVTVRALRAGEPSSAASPSTSSTSQLDGIGADEAKATGAFGAAGDGTVAFTGAHQALARDAATRLEFRVSNVGQVPAVYTVKLAAESPVFNDRSVAVSVDGGSSVITAVIADTRGLTAGKYALTANLSSNTLAVDPLSTVSLDLTFK